MHTVCHMNISYAGEKVCCRRCPNHTAVNSSVSTQSSSALLPLEPGPHIVWSSNAAQRIHILAVCLYCSCFCCIEVVFLSHFFSFVPPLLLFCLMLPVQILLYISSAVYRLIMRLLYEASPVLLIVLALI